MKSLPLAPRGRSSRRRLAALAAGILGSIAVLELGARWFGESLGFPRGRVWELRAYVCDQRSRFAPRAYKGWVFDPGAREVDADGFLDRPRVVEKRAGVLRIACLGGSTTAGNVEHGLAATYPQQLEQVLSAKAATPVEVLNFGIAGWTTAETLANYFLWVQDFAPDVVIYHHAANDAYPRLNAGFRPDYTHFTRAWQWPEFGPVRRFLTRWSDLACLFQLRSWRFELLDHVAIPPRPGPPIVPTPDTARPLERNAEAVLDHVQDVLGGRAVVLTLPWDPKGVKTSLDRNVAALIDEHNEVLRRLAARRGYVLLDFAREADDEQRAEFLDLIHFSPAGNARKAEYVAGRLIAAGLVPALAPLR